MRAVDVVLTLAMANLRARYGRGRLTLLKWLLDPFVLVGVYLLFVALLLDLGQQAPGLSLACAVVPFQIIVMAVFNALLAVVNQRSIILNMSFPRMLIPVAIATTETMGFGASLLLLGLMMAVYGVEPSAALLWLPAVLAVTVLLAMAFAYPATLTGIWFPELADLARSAVRALYFAAPGLIALAEIPGEANELVRINPLTGVFEAYRDVFLYGSAPAAWELLVPIGYAAALLALFVPIYRREDPHLAKVA